MSRSSTTIEDALDKAAAIRHASLTIYDALLPERPDLLFTDDELEALLATSLSGFELTGPLRTRSKVAKQAVATVLGYQVPDGFKRTTPRFPGQDLDVFVQVSDNLQIWNQDVSPERRYVLIRPDAYGQVRAVRVVRGQQVAAWDRTGTLTRKYQAKRLSGNSGSALVSPLDTELFTEVFAPHSVSDALLAGQASSSAPTRGAVLPIGELFERLTELIGTTLPAVGQEQDRARGELLQVAVSSALRLGAHDNHGQWPDIVSQALEVKLQTAPTIDLGLVLPTDEEPATSLNPHLRHCDARYVVAYGELGADGRTRIQEVVVCTGEDFFTEFIQFGGLVSNAKRQIPLPADLFEPYS